MVTIDKIRIAFKLTKSNESEHSQHAKLKGSFIAGLNLRPITFEPKSQFSLHSQHLVSHNQYYVLTIYDNPLITDIEPINPG